MGMRPKAVVRALATGIAVAGVAVVGVAPAFAAAPPSPADAADAPWARVDAALGAAGKDLPGGVHRFGWPRRDLHVRMGEVAVEPALALGSWGAFLIAGGDGKALAMGDLVLVESELAPVIAELEESGFGVTAVHNHLAGESPHVVYVHFSGHGDAVSLAAGLKKALARTATPLAAAPAAAGGSAAATPSAADEQAFARVQQLLGRQGTLAGVVLQIGVPRGERIEEHGIEIPAAMGMATALNFQGLGLGGQVATTGDFVLIAAEVDPVLRELRAHGIEVTALHSHMLAETPRLFFIHFWGVGSPEQIAGGLKAALARVHSRP
jgi:hypothetical protein